jgi:hypothetical protein
VCFFLDVLFGIDQFGLFRLWLEDLNELFTRFFSAHSCSRLRTAGEQVIEMARTLQPSMYVGGLGVAESVARRAVYS